MPNPNPKIENLTRKGMGRIPTKTQKVAKLCRINPETIEVIDALEIEIIREVNL